jgi:NADH-quinone oxidoreductase subunit F
MTKILERIRSGRGKLEDIDLLLEVANSMGIIPGTTICGLSDGAAWPVKNAVMKFRPEFEQYIKSGRSSITPAQELMAVH